MTASPVPADPLVERLRDWRTDGAHFVREEAASRIEQDAATIAAQEREIVALRFSLNELLDACMTEFGDPDVLGMDDDESAVSFNVMRRARAALSAARAPHGEGGAGQ